MTAWCKSSHSSTGGDACVEVRYSNVIVGVRDSKNPDGPRFDVSPTAWQAFLNTVTHPAG
ncbi:DUF397 domain-containing protein [Lentzea sp. BCCO 10_0856]|uniref:DUF397 domain-containing protein n=1 Tax=Lentzea miocenica TaxID=3095431 RepID=A0ABU4SVA4_9PSEU|nr:DUF397 domain-containing protein [Lentzea sp. BCCO 10_0856]MDX8029839.1 DUF397 domain-containing protein [Lentzea sp. BCCO 10_0856]